LRSRLSHTGKLPTIWVGEIVPARRSELVVNSTTSGR